MLSAAATVFFSVGFLLHCGIAPPLLALLQNATKNRRFTHFLGDIAELDWANVAEICNMVILVRLYLHTIRVHQCAITA